MPEPTWEEVEKFLVGSQVVAGLRAKMGGDPVPTEIARALDAVRLVRALEEGTFTDEMVEAGAMQMARHFAEKIPLTRHDDAALAKVRDSFLGEARRIIAAATAALNASKEGRNAE